MTKATRLKAELEGRETYHGEPCKKCGNTERCIERYVCVKCLQEKIKDRSRKRSRETKQ